MLQALDTRMITHADFQRVLERLQTRCFRGGCTRTTVGHGVDGRGVSEEVEGRVVSEEVGEARAMDTALSDTDDSMPSLVSSSASDGPPPLVADSDADSEQPPHGDWLPLLPRSPAASSAGSESTRAPGLVPRLNLCFDLTPCEWRSDCSSVGMDNHCGETSSEDFDILRADDIASIESVD